MNKYAFLVNANVFILFFDALMHKLIRLPINESEKSESTRNEQIDTSAYFQSNLPKTQTLTFSNVKRMIIFNDGVGSYL